MASKKYISLFAAMFVLFQSIGFAQTSTDWGWDWKDSSKIPTKRIPQYNEFLNNQYPYPAKPRDQWELGLSAGSSFILGDRAILTGGYNGGIVGGISLRKSLSHVFSLRGAYNGSIVSIPSNASGFVWAKNYTHMGSIDAIASLNSMSHYRGNPKWDIYVFGGYSLIYTRVMTNQGGSLHNLYYPQTNLIGTSNFPNDVPAVNGRHTWALMHGLSYGAGISYKISNRVNIGIEQRFTVPMFGNDYLDGNKLGNSGDQYSFSTAHLNINLGKTAKRVQPLWWINPYNYEYNELNSPKHMKMPKVVLPDADGDGVTDQFDLEPNTPAGAPVDSHGRAKDTDCDGVPDYRDKEILTPQSCFPVNADGVGTCPEPACCKELRDMIANMQKAPVCNINSLPSVQFKKGSKLSKEAMQLLDAAAASIKANPDCKVKVIGHPAASKAAQQMAWERVNAVIKYLVDKQGISESRFIFSYDGGSGDANTIDLQGTTEDGPNTVPAPHPNLRSRN